VDGHQTAAQWRDECRPAVRRSRRSRPATATPADPVGDPHHEVETDEGPDAGADVGAGQFFARTTLPRINAERAIAEAVDLSLMDLDEAVF